MCIIVKLIVAWELKRKKKEKEKSMAYKMGQILTFVSLSKVVSRLLPRNLCVPRYDFGNPSL